MYAVVETGGKQFRVQPGDIINVEHLDGEPGDIVKLDKVLMVTDDSGVQSGTPFVDGAYVEANILEHGKAKKVKVFKYKSKKNYRRLRGHRQHYTQIKIETVKY